MNEVRTFQSMGEFIDKAANGACDMEGPRASRKVEKGDSPWSGSATFQDAVDRALNGYTEPRAGVDALVGDVVGTMAQYVTDVMAPIENVTGSEVDVAAFLDGIPECMVDYQWTAQPTFGKVVRVLVSSAASCMVETETIIRRGAAIAALVEILARLSFATELWVEQTVKGDRGDTMSVVVRVKEPTQYLDVNDVMFAIAHPAMLRRLTFSVEEQENAATRRRYNIGGNYGYPHKLTQGEAIGAHVTVDLPDNYSPEVKNPLEWLKTTLRDLGVL